MQNGKGHGGVVKGKGRARAGRQGPSHKTMWGRGIGWGRGLLNKGVNKWWHECGFGVNKEEGRWGVGGVWNPEE